MTLIRASLILAAAALAFTGRAEAQSAQRFSCESTDQRTNYCDVDTRGGVVLVRQLSRASCSEGSSWGWDRRGVWVSQGCRAEFETGRGGWNGGRPGGGGGSPGWHGGNPGFGGGSSYGEQRITCESNSQRTNWCALDTRGGVTLVRQLSRGSCIEGRSWGFDRRGVWVSQGCRAEFASGRGGWDGGGQGWNGGGWDNRGGRGQIVRCQSSDGRTQWCGVGSARDVQLHRQLSRAQCIEGRSWGWERRGLWVSQGCRAEFAIR